MRMNTKVKTRLINWVPTRSTTSVQKLVFRLAYRRVERSTPHLMLLTKLVTLARRHFNKLDKTGFGDHTLLVIVLRMKLLNKSFLRLILIDLWINKGWALRLSACPPVCMTLRLQPNTLTYYHDFLHEFFVRVMYIYSFYICSFSPDYLWKRKTID